MPRKKIVPVEEQENNMEALGLPADEGAEGAYEFPEGLPAAEEGAEVLPVDGADPLQEDAGASSVYPGGLPENDGINGAGEPVVEEMGTPLEGESPVVPLGVPEAPGTVGGDAGLEHKTSASLESAASTDTGDAPAGAAESASGETGGASPEAPASPSRSDRQSFYGLNFNELDRNLTAEERQEWNSIYASYRGRSALTGTIIGVDPHSINVRKPFLDALARYIGGQL